VGPPFTIAKLVQTTPISITICWWYLKLNGVYKATNRTEKPHIFGSYTTWVFDDDDNHKG